MLICCAHIRLCFYSPISNDPTQNHVSLCTLNKSNSSLTQKSLSVIQMSQCCSVLLWLLFYFQCHCSFQCDCGIVGISVDKWKYPDTHTYGKHVVSLTWLHSCTAVRLLLHPSSGCLFIWECLKWLPLTRPESHSWVVKLTLSTQSHWNISTDISQELLVLMQL